MSQGPHRTHDQPPFRRVSHTVGALTLRVPLPVAIGQCLALTLAAGSVAPTAPLRAQQGTTSSVCTDPIAQRELLRDERGHLVQITRNGLAARDGEILISGAYSGTFRETADSGATLSSQDSVIAVLRRRDGSTQAYAAPELPGAAPDFVLPVPLRDGAWGLLLKASARDESTRRPVRGTASLWLLRLGEHGGTALMALPRPPHLRSVLDDDPAVAVLGERLIIAYAAEDSSGDAAAVLLEQQADGWTSRTLPAPGMSELALAFDGVNREPVVAIVRPDRSRMSDANSLFVTFPERAANVTQLVAAGGGALVHHPLLVTTADGALLAWQRRPRGGVPFQAYQVEFTELRRREPRKTRSAGEPVERVALVGNATNEPVLVFARRAADGGASPALAMTLLTPRTGDVRASLHLPSASPEATLAALDGDRLLVSHPVILGGGTHLANELLWVSARCTASGGAH